MIKKLYNQNKDFISYAFFGVCTTIVNTLVYWFFADVFNLDTVVSAMIAWFFAVMFAYLTNRKWVFHSQASSASELIKEILAFYACRLGTGFIDWLCMFVFVDLFDFNDLIIKVAANLLVIVLNYVASKLVIFKKKG